MNCLQSVELINSFSLSPLKINNPLNTAKNEALEQQKAISLPQELKLYIEQVCAEKNMTINGVGHPIEFLSVEQLSWKMAGFNFDSVKQKNIAGWQDNWFLIANEGGEPVIVKLDNMHELSPVYSAMKTSDGWDFAQVADSIGQYLVCAKAIEHAMNFPDVDEPLDEDFNLVPLAANWLFPFLKTHAANHFDEWASVFENYLD